MCNNEVSLYDRKERVHDRSEVTVDNRILLESERDSARIIHSAAFRRLQNKMQVQVIGDSDYYRTRLTHTLEVMQIARGIYYYLESNMREKLDEFMPNIHLIEAVCFAHDIGHPPFGHAGEVELNKCMQEYGGFEGNAQTLHILSTGKEHSKESGFNLMRRTLLGVIKYPVLYSNIHNSAYRDKPPKCIYDIEKSVLEWILLPFDDEDKGKFIEFEMVDGKHGKSKYKSFDCSLMNMADDIAYACHDLEDAIKLSILPRETVRAILTSDEHSETLSFLFEKLEGYDGDLTDNIDKFLTNLYYKDEYKTFFSSLIGFFIKGCEVQIVDNFKHSLLKYNIAFIDDKYKKVLELFKETITYKKVISNYKIKQMEYKGQNMIKDVFNAFMENSDEFLPPSVREKYKDLSKDGKARVICDYIAGMSDNFLVKIYSRLFMPNYGSIGDLL